jgi:hypothetical protein
LRPKPVQNFIKETMCAERKQGLVDPAQPDCPAAGEHEAGRGGIGANDGDRTRDNRYHKPALYQLSYVRHRGRAGV